MSEEMKAKCSPPCILTVETGKHEWQAISHKHQAGDRFWIPYCPLCGWIDTEQLVREANEKLLELPAHQRDVIKCRPNLTAGLKPNKKRRYVMKSVFSISGDNDGSIPSPSYDLEICFNGVPNTVVLEISQVTYPAQTAGQGCGPSRAILMRSLLKSSHARAIASALLSAATEVRPSAAD